MQTARGNTAEGLIATLDRIDAAKTDAITDTRALFMHASPAAEEGTPIESRVVIAARGTDLRMNVLRGAHQQIAERTQIPWKYYERMLGGQPDLLADNVNRWFNSEPQKRLVRMMGAIDEEDEQTLARTQTTVFMRAMLSDSYRPIDHGEVVRQVVPIAEQHGAVVEGWDLSEKHFHFRMVTPERDVAELAEQIKRDRPDLPAHFVGLREAVQTGIAIRNSETGHAAYSAQPMVKILRCVNLLVVTESLRMIHTGGRAEGEDFAFQEDTRRLDNAAVVLKLRDHAVNVFSAASTEKTLLGIAAAQAEPIEIPEKMHTMEFVTGVGRTFELTETETKILEEEFLQELPISGLETRMTAGKTPSRWTLSQALTATAKSVDDAERRHQIQQFGWEVLGKPVGALIRAASTN